MAYDADLVNVYGPGHWTKVRRPVGVAAGKGAQQKRDESGLRYGHPGLVGQPDQLGD